jgi:hypothetical protein
MAEPLGYRTIYRWAPDYDGNDPWVPASGLARMTFDDDAAPTIGPTIGNLATRGGKVQLVAANTGSEGAGFAFRAPVPPGRREWEGLFSQSAFDMAKGYSPSPWVPLLDQDPEVAAIGSRKVTDALLLSPIDLPVDVDLHPGRIEARAGWLSAAYLFREAAWRVLEAAPEELSAGFTPLATPMGLSGELYLTDTLLNGAGYARYFTATERRLQELADAAQARVLAYSGHAGPEGEECRGSCYACLQDWSNSRLHPLLDWRLGSDLAGLLLGEGFSSLRWADHGDRAARSFAAGVAHWHAERVADRTILRSERASRVCVVTHPFEAVAEFHRGPNLARVAAQAEAEGSEVRFCSWFRLLRMPGHVLIALDSAEHD